MEDFKDLCGGSEENAGIVERAEASDAFAGGENAGMPEEAQEHLSTESTSLSLEDLDAAAGGRGRKKYQPRRHIGPDARSED